MAVEATVVDLGVVWIDGDANHVDAIMAGSTIRSAGGDDGAVIDGIRMNLTKRSRMTGCTVSIHFKGLAQRQENPIAVSRMAGEAGIMQFRVIEGIRVSIHQRDRIDVAVAATGAACFH